MVCFFLHLGHNPQPFQFVQVLVTVVFILEAGTVVLLAFPLSALWWMRLRGLSKLPDGRDWWREKLGLLLVGRAMLSKTLIHIFVDGQGSTLPVSCLV